MTIRQSLTIGDGKLEMGHHTNSRVIRGEILVPTTYDQMRPVGTTYIAETPEDFMFGFVLEKTGTRDCENRTFMRVPLKPTQLVRDTAAGKKPSEPVMSIAIEHEGVKSLLMPNNPGARALSGLTSPWVKIQASERTVTMEECTIPVYDKLTDRPAGMFILGGFLYLPAMTTDSYCVDVRWPKDYENGQGGFPVELCTIGNQVQKDLSYPIENVSAISTEFTPNHNP